MIKYLAYFLTVISLQAAQGVRISAYQATNNLQPNWKIIVADPNGTNYSMAISNLSPFILGGRLDTNYTYPMAGWGIDTPFSQYEPPMHGLVLRSLGSSLNTNNGGGDGYLQINSNLAGSNSSFFSYKGDIFFSSSTDFFNKKPVLLTSANSIQLGGFTNLPYALFLRNSGSYKGVMMTIGYPWLNVPALSTTHTLNISATNIALGGTLYSSTTPVYNTDSSEDTLLFATIPASGLTNSQDLVEFTASGRYALTGDTKTLKVYYGSTLIASPGAMAISNATWTVKGSIVANADLATQFVLAQLFLNGSNAAYFSTNWNLTITETNGLDTVLKVTGTCATANAITNNYLNVRMFPAPPQTYP